MAAAVTNLELKTNSFWQDLYKQMPQIDLVQEKLYQIIKSTGGPTSEIGIYLLESGGKRIRPLLTLLSGGCFSCASEKLINVAAAAELIHMASLVHDDIIDNSNSRRGKATINSIHGNKISVLVGDNLFAKAFELLSKNSLYGMLNLMVDVIETMCAGEINQALNGFNFNQTEEIYYDTIYKKTAKLISYCCQSGPEIAEMGREEILALREYGRNLGYVFQIVDDILDLRGEIEITGKPPGLDLAQGTLTLPILMLLKKGDYRTRLAELLQNNKSNEEMLKEINQVLNDTGVIGEAYEEAESLSYKAKNSLKILPQSAYKDALMEIANMALNREN